MDIALEDIKYENSLIKIDELEKKLESTYSKLQLKDNEHLQDVIESYKKYIENNKQLKEKKREALENILEHIEGLEGHNKRDIKIISKELKKFY